MRLTLSRRSWQMQLNSIRRRPQSSSHRTMHQTTCARCVQRPQQHEPAAVASHFAISSSAGQGLRAADALADAKAEYSSSPHASDLCYRSLHRFDLIWPFLLSLLLHADPPPASQAERRLQEEVERVRAYLDESTEPKITRVAEQELIAKQVRPHAARLTLTTAVSWPTGWA
jgi:hypothetical protein